MGLDQNQPHSRYYDSTSVAAQGVDASYWAGGNTNFATPGATYTSPGDYYVSLSSAKISNWTNANYPVEYFIALENSTDFHA